jgi:homoserine O-acetyltransferase/O-succinyltransferase
MNTKFMGQVAQWVKAFLPALMLTGNAAAATPPPTPSTTPVAGDYVIKGFTFTSGETLPELRIHYLTFGKPVKDAHGMVRNAVLIGHGTGGSADGFLRPQFAGELFGPGQPLDAAKYFIVLPDGIGHGKSSKPSDGLHAHFPHYGYTDMVTAQFRLLTEGLGVNHARLIMGTSMGGMHTWVWGEQHPDFMDALMPLASLPAQVAGRNRGWRLLGIEAIRNDPEWHGGDYQKQPAAFKTVAGMLWFVSSNPVVRQHQAPTLAQADQALEEYVADFVKTNDANDIMYALDASHDYDPGPGLEKIRVPLLAVNSADDLINPPELGILEREIKRVPHGRAIVIPLSDRTAGHQTHSLPAIWKGELERLLRESAATNDVGSKVSN